ncbi:hypothetical protein BN2497_2773 [Janthinobacterium sp. CG23_2]|nr:hypothetical protein BN2497_2773 [Janthinobacterium sp. CG23_2]CUU27784.1 hypothetical protein BN3177_2773 [Janthinobacterium sp. CG23_2]
MRQRRQVALHACPPRVVAWTARAAAACGGKPGWRATRCGTSMIGLLRCDEHSSSLTGVKLQHTIIIKCESISFALIFKL